VRFKEVVSPEYYRRLRLSFFRLHYQFIMSGDRRAPYDYLMLGCGPGRDRRLGAASRSDGRRIRPGWRRSAARPLRAGVVAGAAVHH